MKYNERGEEILDTTPVAVPVGIKKQLPLNERIKQMVRYEASRIAEDNGFESFKDADDFNIPDDPVDPQSPWEENFDPEVPFIAEREATIRHGITKDIDEEKIHAGFQELEKINKNKIRHNKKAAKALRGKKTSPEEMSEVEDEQSFQEDSELLADE